MSDVEEEKGGKIEGGQEQPMETRGALLAESGDLVGELTEDVGGGRIVLVKRRGLSDVAAENLNSRSVDKRIFSLNLGTTDREEALSILEQREARRFERFLETFMDSMGIREAEERKLFAEKVAGNAKLKSDIEVLMQFEEGPREKTELVNSVETELLGVYGGRPDAEQNFKKSYQKVMLSRRRDGLTKRILRERPEASEVMLEELTALDLEFNDPRNTMTWKEYQLRRNEIIQRAIGDDEELTKQWQAYVEEEKSYSNSFGREFELDLAKDDQDIDGAEKVNDSQEIEEVISAKEDFQSFRSAGFKIDLKPGGQAEVALGGDFSVNLTLHKFSSGKYIYRLVDRFAGEPLIVPTGKLLVALDNRNKDAILSKELYENPLVADEVGKIQDEQLTLLVDQVIGDGETRGFQVKGRGLELIKKLSKVLVVDSGIGVAEKVESLVRFLSVKSNEEAFRRKLIEMPISEPFSLIDILG